MTAQPATPAATRRSILLLSLATFTSMSTQRICDAMLPELSRVFEVGLPQAARVVSVFAIVYGVLQLFYGPLGDRLGKFRVIAWATLACSLGNLLAVFAGSLELLVFSRMLVAVFAAAIIPLTLAWLGDVAEPGRLQETIARVGLGTALGVGSGQLFGGLVTDWLGWRWAFGLLALLFAFVGSLLLRDLARQGPVRPRTAAPLHFLAQLAGLLVQPWPRTILLVGILEGGAGFGALALWASHLHHALGFSLSAAGGIVALFGLGGVCYMAAARPLIHRLGAPALARLGSLLVLVSATVIGFAPGGWPAIPASLVAGFGFFAFHNVMQAAAAQMAPAARGSAVALFAASLFLGQSAGVTLATAAAARFGAAPVIALSGAVIALLGAWFAQRLQRRETAPR
jgi:predicted MFS family arabinose efflux permease